MDVSFLRLGSLEDDDCDVDVSRKGAREVVKANKRGKCESVSATPVNENATDRAAIAMKMKAHTKMANMRLVMQFGTAEEKAMVMKDVMMDLTSANNA
jgi:hypothetical protein